MLDPPDNILSFLCHQATLTSAQLSSPSYLLDRYQPIHVSFDSNPLVSPTGENKRHQSNLYCMNTVVFWYFGTPESGNAQKVHF